MSSRGDYLHCILWAPGISADDRKHDHFRGGFKLPNLENGSTLPLSLFLSLPAQVVTYEFLYVGLLGRERSGSPASPGVRWPGQPRIGVKSVRGCTATADAFIRYTDHIFMKAPRGQDQPELQPKNLSVPPEGGSWCIPGQCVPSRVS